MRRTQLCLEPDQHDFLVEEARRMGVSMAELVRQLVDRRMKDAVRDVDIFEELAGCADSSLSTEEADDVAINHDDYIYRLPNQ